MKPHNKKTSPLNKIIHLFTPRLHGISVSELELARKIQQHFLPHTFPLPSKIEVGTLFKPSKYIGGDFYDVIQIDKRKIAFMVGDVSGNSIPAALFMAQCLTLLQAFIRMDLSLLKILEKTNQILFEIAKADMFATVFIGIFDSYYNQLSYVNAGHNPPLLIRQSTFNILNKDTKAMGMLSAEGMALNCTSPIILEEKRIQLFKGDTILFYTDGLIEACNSKEETFGELRLKELMSELDALPAQQIADTILKRIEEFTQNNTIENDDMAALVVKFKEIA